MDAVNGCCGQSTALAGAGMDGTLRAAELTRERVGVLEEYLGTL